jgi:hypothetical protein
LSFGESSCGTSSETLPLEIYYSNAILAQRWGDVLAVTNENYNGGYEFVAYQWFKNGVLIEGATSSILYVEEGLDLTARYSVLLTRKSDNLSLMTCDADLVDYSNVEDSRVVVFTLNERDVNVEVSQHARMRVWLSSGILLNEKYLQEGVNSMSLMQGIYILEFIFEDNSREIRQIVVN